jgi:radical SAM-linked protein
LQVIAMAGSPPIGKPDLNRLRVRFGKDGRLAYLGHLEVINTIERSVRRAALPFSVGNGFARRMRVQFSQALPVGAASTCEYYDLYLTERVDAREALGRLADSTPSAMAPVEAAYVGGRLPALEAWLTRSEWKVRLLGDGSGFCAQALDEALEALVARGSIDFMRGDKPRTIGLDTTLVSWDVADGTTEGSFSAIDMRLETRSSNLGALRPAVLMEAAFKRGELGGSVLDSLRVERMGQWHEGEDGSLIDPMAAELRI